MNFKDEFILSNILIWFQNCIVSASGKKEKTGTNQLMTVVQIIVSSPGPDTISAIDDLPKKLLNIFSCVKK